MLLFTDNIYILSKQTLPKMLTANHSLKDNMYSIACIFHLET